MYLEREQDLLRSINNNTQKELQATNMEDSNIISKGKLPGEFQYLIY